MTIEQEGGTSEQEKKFSRENFRDLEAAERIRTRLLGGESNLPDELKRTLMEVDLSGLTTEIAQSMTPEVEMGVEIRKEEGKVAIGFEQAPIFTYQEEARWQPQFRPVKGGRYFAVELVSPDGQVFFDEDIVTDDDNPDNPEVQATIRQVETRRQKAQEKRAVEAQKMIPEMPPSFEWTPYGIAKMEEFVRLTNHQLEQNEGLTWIEGEAGTGKNWLVDAYGHLTERPVFRFTCSESRESQDFKYFLEYDPNRGTYRIPSSVIEAIRTPGAILILDEINTTRPEVLKELNSLLDYSRTVYYGENHLAQKAVPGVLIVGLMNPEYYMGVKPLAETVRDRGLGMKMDYPPFEEQDEQGRVDYHSDEALILRKHIPELKDLSTRDFQNAWDVQINGFPSAQAIDILTSERATRLGQIKELLQIGSKIRNAYRAYRTTGGDRVPLSFSLRASRDCARFLGKSKQADVKGVIKSVYLNKISDPEEQALMEALITKA